jgi:hypothetical protein
MLPHFLALNGPAGMTSMTSMKHWMLTAERHTQQPSWVKTAATMLQHQTRKNLYCLGVGAYPYPAQAPDLAAVEIHGLATKESE